MAIPQLSSIQAPEFFIQLAKNSKEIYPFYKLIQKQICNAQLG
jgi:hypothetical protein